MAYLQSYPGILSSQPCITIRDSDREMNPDDVRLMQDVALRSNAPVLGQALHGLLGDHAVRYTVAAPRHDLVAGFAAYAFEPGVVAVKVLAVHPHFQCRGIARLLLDDLKTRLSGQHPTLSYLIEDRRTVAIAFLGHVGMRAVKPVLHDHFGTGHDGYTFVWPNADAGLAAGNCPEECP